MQFHLGFSALMRFWRASICALISTVVLFVGAFASHAAEPPQRQAYHATVSNGTIVGSAFKISDGVLVTNAHVLAGRKPGQSVRLTGPSGARFSGRITAISTRMDLAVLSVSRNALPTVPGNAARTRLGAHVIAVGVVAGSRNPRKSYAINGTVSSAPRTLSPFGRGVIVQMPHVRRGFSGGPVFDQNGRFFGMVAALRPAEISSSGVREAFILTAADIHAEITRLASR